MAVAAHLHRVALGLVDKDLLEEVQQLFLPDMEAQAAAVHLRLGPIKARPVLEAQVARGQLHP